MRVLALGCTFDGADRASFRSAKSMLDYDVVIADPQAMFDDYERAYPSVWNGLPRISNDDSPKLIGDLIRRRAEIIEMVGLGRTVVVFVPPPVEAWVWSGKSDVSGTGKNARTTNLVDKTSVTNLIPLEVKLVHGEGRAMEVIAGEPFAKFWRSVSSNSIYRAYIEGADIGSVLATIKGTNRAVATRYRAKGNLLLIPDFDVPDSSGVVKHRAAMKGFLESLLEYIGSFGGGEAAALPEWADAVSLPGEADERNKLAEIELEVTRQLEARDAQRVVVERTAEPKLLFGAIGTPLENAVAAAFSRLGAAVERGPEGRADLIIVWRDQVAVIEVKGVNKSAAEKQAAQLEKWVSEYFSEHGVQPKGILVVNAFCDVPPQDRTDDAFPAQMLTYSERRGHCLMTGLQLLGATIEADSSGTGATTLDEVFQTAGVYPRFGDFLRSAKARVRTKQAKAERGGKRAALPDSSSTT